MSEATSDHSSPAAGRGPLTGVTVLELGGIGPGPFCGMLLGDLGAEVIRVEHPDQAGKPTLHPVLHRNRRSVAIDLKQPEGAAAALALAGRVDVLIEGFRPGVAERLGLGPGQCLAANPALVYGRMTGWGQDGPLAQEPGHDINYIALAGALHTIAPQGGDPVPPLNLVGDFGGGGMLLALGVLGALLHARGTGRGQVVDAAMTDGTALLLAMTYGLLGQGLWQDRPAANLLDGGAPFYRTYRCADGGHVAVGAIEPQFYAALLRVLELTGDPLFAAQQDRAAWPAMTGRLAGLFATRDRDAWAAAFAGQGACVTPVLSLTEAPADPHNSARGTYRRAGDGSVQPSPAPRFSATPTADPTAAPATGADTRSVLSGGALPGRVLSEEQLDALFERGVLG